MAMGHAGEQGLHWAITEAGPPGAVGAIVGAFLGWPRAAQEHLNGLTLTTYHNAVAHGDIVRVVETGIGLAAVIAVAFGLIGRAIFHSGGAE